MDASEIGLLFLMAAWFIQTLYALRGERELQKPFLLIYATGAVILILDGIDATGFSSRALQNLFILACISIIILKNPKR
jgi:hypothetical protein